MPEYYFDIAHLSSFQEVPVDPEQDPRYNTKHLDDWWFCEQIKHFEKDSRYFQKVQHNDVFTIQRRSTLGAPETAVYNAKGEEVVPPIIWTLKPTSIIGQPWSVYEITLDFASIKVGDPLDDGLYWLYTTAGTSPIAKSISEGIYVKEKHPGTILIEATHHENDLGVIWETGIVAKIRIDGTLRAMDTNFKRKVSSYEDQTLNRKNNSSVPYSNIKLILASDDNTGVAPWLPKKLNFFLCCSSLKFDGKEYVAEGEELEKQSVVGYPKGAWTVDLREGKNRYYNRIMASGEITSSYTIVYNINTKLFGSLNAPPSSIDLQITDIE